MTRRSQLVASVKHLSEQLEQANETIRKQTILLRWLTDVLLTRSHRLVSAVRRIFRMKPEMPAGALESFKNAKSASAEQPKNLTSPVNSR